MTSVGAGKGRLPCRAFAVTCIDVLDRVPLTVAALVENRIAANLAEPIGPIFRTSWFVAELSRRRPA